jgi:DNA polymerase-1
MQKNKLFLLDAMALIYRAHFAFSKNPRVSSKGINTGAVLGFTNTLFDIIRKEKPTHLAVAIDTKAPTFRHVQYTEYKAQRDAQPEDISIAIPYIKNLLQAMQIPLIGIDGFEADDVVGTLAKKAPKEEFDVFMVTMDKDYAQLVDENIFFYKVPYAGSKEPEIMGIPEILEKWDIERVEQVIDVLGLQGDASDNIPGIPGIGAKTAVKLLKQFGSMENLVKNTDQLKGKQKENVINFTEQGLLSKELATICLTVPVEFEEEKYKLNDFQNEEIKNNVLSIFEELEFRTLGRRIFKQELTKKTSNQTLQTKSSSKKSKVPSNQVDLFATMSSPKATVQNEVLEDNFEDNVIQNQQKDTINTVLYEYFLMDTPQLRKELLHFLKKQKAFAFDTETTGLKAYEADIVGISFAYQEGEAFYVPIPAKKEEAQQILNEFKELLEDENTLKIGQNIKYDYTILQNYGIRVKGQFFDTMLAHYLIEPDMRHNMEVLSENYLNYTPVSIETLIGKKGKKQGNMRDLPPEKVYVYACEDADITFKLWKKLAPIIEERGHTKLFYEVENPLVPVLAEMEREGVKINKSALNDFSKQIFEEVQVIEKQIFEEAGMVFNIASPKQMGEVLFEHMKLDPKAKRTSKSKQYQTGEKVLLKLADKHPIIKHILDYRQLQKLKSTYVDALPLLISTKDERIHTNYRQAVASTGRLSSQNPNLQNIPIRTHRGREVRKAFVSKNDDFVLMAVDYSQIELRIMAAFSQDKNMLEAFQNDKDIHSATAAKLYKVPLEEVDTEMRRRAKTANFGIIYGVSAFGLASQLEIPRKEAKALIDSYFEEFSAIKTYMDKVTNQAKEDEYVETILGRKRYLRDINSRNSILRGYAERNAVNAPIQGSAADIIKVAMINIQKWLEKENLQSKMTMQVHDELVFDVAKSELEIVRAKVIELMENAIEIDVPLKVEAGIGENWLEAH